MLALFVKKAKELFASQGAGWSQIGGGDDDGGGIQMSNAQTFEAPASGVFSRNSTADSSGSPSASKGKGMSLSRKPTKPRANGGSAAKKKSPPKEPEESKVVRLEIGDGTDFFDDDDGWNSLANT